MYIIRFTNNCCNKFLSKSEDPEDALEPLVTRRILMNNKKIRIAMLECDLSQWELAKLLGISESQMSRKLRDELPEDEQEKIVSLIEEGGESNDDE